MLFSIPLCLCSHKIKLIALKATDMRHANRSWLVMANAKKRKEITIPLAIAANRFHHYQLPPVSAYTCLAKSHTRGVKPQWQPMAPCPLIAPSYPRVSAELTGKTHRPDGQSLDKSFEFTRPHPELLYNVNKVDILLEAVYITSDYSISTKHMGDIAKFSLSLSTQYPHLYCQSCKNTRSF